MGDLAAKNFNSTFEGLVSTAYVLGGTAGLCLCTFEVVRQVQRLPKRRMYPFWRRTAKLNTEEHPNRLDDPANEKAYPHGRRTHPEQWHAAHTYQPRQFHASAPSPPLSKWPLMWIYQALRLSDEFFASHVGMDGSVYIRFLRMCTWWVTLHTFTTAPILLGIHETYASSEIPTVDMARASIASLVNLPSYKKDSCAQGDTNECVQRPNKRGRHLLFVHLILLWYITISWVLALIWFIRGTLRLRKRLIYRTYDRLAGGEATGEEPTGPTPKKRKDREEEVYWHLLSPEKQDVRSQQTGYAADPLHPFSSASTAERNPQWAGWRKRTLMIKNLPMSMRSESRVQAYIERHLGYVPSEGMPSPIQEVVLVRKMGQLQNLVQRQQEVRHDLELCHIRLVRNVVAALAKVRPEDIVSSNTRENDDGSTCSTSSAASEHEPRVALARYLATHLLSTSPWLDHLPFVRQFNPSSGDEGGKGRPTEETLWDGLVTVPRHLLDPYQPQVRVDLPEPPVQGKRAWLKRAVRRSGRLVAESDYLTLRYNWLGKLVSDMRSKPPTAFKPTSTTFVTFRDPRQARLVWREARWLRHPTIVLAPEARDLDWVRINHATYSSELVRGTGAKVMMWALTLFWIWPISILASVLTNVQTLKTVFPVLQNLFERFPRLEAWISVTLPSLLVSLFNMCVPEMIFQISQRAQGFTTKSALYDMCLCRYWKFTMITSLLFFCVGTTAIQTALIQIANEHTSSLKTSIASAFPSAAPFFVSYLMLTIATQSCLQLVQLIMGVVRHISAVRAKTPRARWNASYPRAFYAAQILPQHLLILSIIFVFALLNPLVLPFGLVYLVVALTVFKRSFAYTFFRTYVEHDGKVYAIRIMRYSLDSLVVAQAVLLIFFAVAKVGKAYIGMVSVLIPLTVITKLILTRYWRSQVRYLDDLEANVLAGLPPTTEQDNLLAEPAQLDQPGQWPEWGSAAKRAGGRYPLHMPPSTDENEQVLWRWWHALLDTFSANGYDQPGYTIWLYSPRRKTQVREMVHAQQATTDEHHPVTASDWFVHHGPLAWFARYKDKKRYVAAIKEEAALPDDGTVPEDQAEVPSGSQDVYGPEKALGFDQRVSYVDASGVTTPKRMPMYRSGETTQINSGAGDDSQEVVWLHSRPHHTLWWDDRVDNLAHFDYPFYAPLTPACTIPVEGGRADATAVEPSTQSLDGRPGSHFLWLPRDPTSPLIDLCDTIEWPCSLVSSDARGGELGNWVQHLRPKSSLRVQTQLDRLSEVQSINYHEEDGERTADKEDEEVQAFAVAGKVPRKSMASVATTSGFQPIHSRKTSSITELLPLNQINTMSSSSSAEGTAVRHQAPDPSTTGLGRRPESEDVVNGEGHEMEFDSLHDALAALVVAEEQEASRLWSLADAKVTAKAIGRLPKRAVKKVKRAKPGRWGKKIHRHATPEPGQVASDHGIELVHINAQAPEVVSGRHLGSNEES